MRTSSFWVLLALASCSTIRLPATGPWHLQATYLNATTGEILHQLPIPGQSFHDPESCVKAALELGPAPVVDNVAVSVTCQKAENII